MMNPENTFLDYRKIEAEVRVRARQLKSEYIARVPQARWLRLDLDGYYPGGPKGEMRVDYFLETAQRYQKAVPEVLTELSCRRKNFSNKQLSTIDE